MPIDVTCDGCGARFKAPDAAAGKKGKCKKCGAVIAVPVPEPVPAAASDDDMYDIAEPPPLPPAKAPPPLPSVAQAPPYRPSTKGAAAPAPGMAYGVPAANPNAGSWKTSNNPPKIMAVLKGVAGVILLGLGGLFLVGAILSLTSDDGPNVRRPFKGLFFGLFLVVTGGGLIAKAFGWGGGDE